MVSFASALYASRRVSKRSLTPSLLITMRPVEFISVYTPCINHYAAKLLCRSKSRSRRPRAWLRSDMAMAWYCVLRFSPTGSSFSIPVTNFNGCNIFHHGTSRCPASSNTFKLRALEAMFSLHAKIIFKCTAGTLPQHVKLRWIC